MTREEASKILKSKMDGSVDTSYEWCECVRLAIQALEQMKEGRWKQISPAKIYECSECGRNVMTDDICAYKFCHGCGARMGVE